MYTDRLTFCLDARTLDALQRLATDYRCSVAAIVRDAIARLLDDEPAYCAMLLERLGYAAPSPEQARASQELIAEAMAVDLTALFAQTAPPRDPGQSLHSARQVLPGTASVLRTPPERQYPRPA
jgi:hypothetical protein